ncbi:hypothetical protein TL16_g03347 [Triparma laevis f. inornata]|uniref:lytic cellulose monooxygenase (C4-dehydrogenating) n=1 Tax=Triparma laevis f. inornata TaxID=1714386 RepID=A0A9W7A2J0_9STRA|nr:hypothetical protein TL16_g03347 [Triparma laevis f. inornata]
MCSGHGRLISPTTRNGNTGYEDDPVPNLASSQFICRNTNSAASTAATAGSDLALRWRFGAAHVGDCSVYISYDTGAVADMKFFKIANLPDCRSQNNQDVSITLPSWLPAGTATMRWDWPALHVYPRVEFYSQCSTLEISGSASSLPSDVTMYDVRDVYPESGSVGVGYRNPFNQNTEQFMTGPACAAGVIGNNCELTAAGTTGNTLEVGGSGGGGDADGGDNGGGGGSVPGEAPSSLCQIVTVEAGDTLVSIANSYTAQGYPTTWQEICEYNGIVDCDNIEVGETYVIPGSCGEEDGPGGGGMKGGLVGAVCVLGVGLLAGLGWKVKKGIGGGFTFRSGAGVAKAKPVKGGKAFNFKMQEMI